MEHINETQAYEALRAAQLHQHLGQMASSAKLCAETAEAFFNKGNFADCHRCALRSLAYSVGILSPVHARHKSENLWLISVAT
jgi:hypothetical protein